MRDCLSDRICEAKRGSVSAQIYVGTVLCADVNNKRNFKDGLHYLHLAAKNNANAQYILGKIYSMKLKDDRTAYVWLQKSAQNGYLLAIVNTALCLQLGVGTKKNISSAIQWYQKAADRNHPIAQHNLGYIYYMGQDYPQDFKKAFENFTTAANNGYFDAFFALGKMYYYGQYVPKDIGKAVYWFEQSVLFGKQEACWLLGNIYHESNELMMDNAKALSWYEKGMELGNAVCAHLAGYMHYDGLGCDVDYRQAFHCRLFAAQRGLGDACLELAHMILLGEGVEKNPSEAEAWLTRAVTLGCTDALELLEKVRRIIGRQEKTVSRISTAGHTAGESFGRSYRTGQREMEAREEQEEREQAERRQGIMRAARSKHGANSFSDDDFGFVFSSDGEIVQHVDEDLGLIFDSNGKAAFYDEKAKTMFDPEDSSLSYYSDTFNMTYNLKTGEKSYHDGSRTLKF